MVGTTLRVFAHPTHPALAHGLAITPPVIGTPVVAG